MKRDQRTELLKLGIAITLAAFLWQQVSELRKARGGELPCAGPQTRCVEAGE